jgi:hypothetical protein
MNCDLDGYSRYAQCTDHYVQKCGSDMGSTQCAPFMDQYCNLQGANNTADVAITLPFAIASAEVNGLGEQRADATPLPIDPLRVSLGAHETLTVRVH